MEVSPKVSELWRQLQVGDRVRIVGWPSEFKREALHRETIELYEWLINTRSVLTVVNIDSTGLPEGHIDICDADGTRSEYVLLNHDGLARV